MSQINRIFLLFVIILSVFAISANAGDWNDARMRLLVHNSIDLNSVELRQHFIPAPNLAAENLTPLIYQGFGWKLSSNFDLEPAIGYNFGFNEPILSLRLKPMSDYVYSWTDIEWRPDSGAGYYFSQVQWVLASKFFEIGLEAEGWGSYDKNDWSHGFGPNMVLHYSEHWTCDMAIHWRELAPGDGYNPELFIRVHLKP